MSPSRPALQHLIESCGITLSHAQYDQLWAYHRLLRAANAELNLTRIHNFENMVLKHYVDSLLVLNFEALPNPTVDMGSGPGLPGIPLAIARPDCRLILAETRANRTAFLQTVVEKIGLKNVEVHTGSVGARFQRPVRGLISRAVASIEETLERARYSLEPGGRVLFMKGPDCDDEVEAAVSGPLRHEFRLDARHDYAIPGTAHQRRLIVFERRAADPAADANGEHHAMGGRIPRTITSAANPTYRLARDLLSGRGIRKQEAALIAGMKIVPEVLSRHADCVTACFTFPGGPELSDLPESGVPVYEVEPGLFRELDVSGTRFPLLMVKVPEMPAWSPEAEWPEGCTLFVPFQDPENVGAIIRTAAAFGVSRLVLLREAAHPFHPRASRAAGTALFQVRFETGPSIQDLSTGPVPLLALDAQGEILSKSTWPDRFGLLPGVEGPGLPETLEVSARLRIPICEGVESLNAAAATAIGLYAWQSRNS